MLLSFIILFSGCDVPVTPEDQYKSWTVTATSSGGVIKQYKIKSVDRPVIQYDWMTTKIYKYNENPTPFENTYREVLQLPEGWLVEISENEK